MIFWFLDILRNASVPRSIIWEMLRYIKKLFEIIEVQWA
jgi:hypothetical protein